ncbi:MAG: amidohydrolase, partial [Pseudonocardiaceae bacterium]
LRLRAATVLTMDPRHPVAREIGIWQGRVVALDEAAAALPARRTEDLGEVTVLPGFVDAHVHLAWTGLRSHATSIAPCCDAATVLATIGAAARQRPAGGWIDVVGYDQRCLGRHLNAAELDAAAPEHRVLVLHDSGHACVVNTAVLDQLPPGTAHTGGVLTESGTAAVRAQRQPYPLSELVDAISAAAGECLTEGVTSVAEAGIGGGLISHSPIELAAYQQALEHGRLPIRVQVMVSTELLRPVEAHAEDAVARAMDLGLRTGLGDERLSIGALKIFTDGGMMARTAALTTPYCGADHTGQLYADPAGLTAAIVDGHRAGWQLAVHAIGDRAVDLTLDALQAAQRAHPRPQARHRIEHAGLVRPDQLPRCAALGVTAVVQPNFLWYLGDDYAEIMGPHRAPWLYRGRAFLDHGIRLAGSSDRPVTPGAPLRAIQCMVQRQTSSGRTVGPDEAITVEQALRAYTTDAAHACHAEDRVGSLTPGRLADAVVLAEDPRHADPDHIGDIKILATLVGGVATSHP